MAMPKRVPPKRESHRERDQPLKEQHRKRHHRPLLEAVRLLERTMQKHIEGKAKHDDLSKQLMGIIRLQEEHRLDHLKMIGERMEYDEKPKEIRRF